jgi:uncharacterized protein (DUF2147 family)
MAPRVAIALFALFSAPLSAAAPVTGQWIPPEKDSVIEVSQCGGAICGRVVRFLVPTPEGPPVDKFNPNPALRKRPILGLPFLSGFTDAGTNWKGSIYNPREGKTYKSYLQLQKDGRLKVQGCVGPFCKSMYWTRAR